MTTDGAKTILFPVSDLSKATAVYTALLGLEPQTVSDYYVGFDVAGQHIGLTPGGDAVAYWHVSDLDAKLAELTGAGATVKEAPKQVGPGRTVATVTDLDGNVIGLLEDK
jgi:predicted enzyme related to lactoylglutathione lyase